MFILGRSYYGFLRRLAGREVNMADFGQTVEARYENEGVALFKKARVAGTRQSAGGQYDRILLPTAAR